ncbi:MAG: transposase [Desulfobacca sp.]|nr:transposase [Desulfobacca sp.]
MDKDGYQRGSHTVTDLKYHFVWRTKYSYGVLRGKMAMRVRDIIRQAIKRRQDKSGSENAVYHSAYYCDRRDGAADHVGG